MAMIGNVYVWLENEDVKRNIETTSHPVEKGIDVTDHVSPKANEISISGEIVGENATNDLATLKSYMQKGTLLNYVGRNVMNNMQIVQFDTGHPNTIWGGCSFSMTLKEVRIAQSSYTVKKAGTQQINKNTVTGTPVYHTVKSGDTVWLLFADSKAPYRSYGKDCNWVMQNNPSAFSKKGDFKSLKVGAKLIVGYK